MKNRALLIFAAITTAAQSPLAMAHHEVSSAVNAQSAFLVLVVIGLVVAWQFIKERL